MACKPLQHMNNHSYLEQASRSSPLVGSLIFQDLQDNRKVD
jgi:hypothetical protein